MDVTTYALLISYVNNALKNFGGGSGGRNCTISKITPVDGGNEVVFAWYLDDGTAQTTSLIVKDGKDGADGVGIKAVNINADNKIVCTMSDGTTITSQDPLALESDDVEYTNTNKPTVSNVKGALDNIFTQLDDPTAPNASDILFDDGESLQKKFEDKSLAKEGVTYSAGTGIQIDENHVIATKDIKKNYVDNSNFRINQNGKSEYSTPNEYTVDRWYIDGGILTPTENGVLFTNPNTATGTSSLTMTDMVGCIVLRPSMDSLHYLYSCGAIYLLVEHTRMVKIDFATSERMLTEDISALKGKVKTLEALIKELTIRMDDAGF